MEMNMRKSKLYSCIKTITTILVVLGHVIVMYTSDGAIEVGGESRLLEWLKNIIYAFHMPLFIMVTGCVYGYCLEAGKYKDSLGFIKNKACKLLIPYFFFGIFLVAPVMKYVGLLPGSLFQYILEGIGMSRNPRHLWYIMALFIIFILYLPVKEQIRKGGWGILIGACYSIFLYAIALKVPQDFQIRRACLDQIWFFTGILLNQYYNKIDFLIVKIEKIGSRLPDLWNSKIMKSIERNAFGIYLIHAMVNYVFFYWFGMSEIPPVLLSGAIFLSVMLLSVGATEFLRKIGLKIVIGE